MGEHTSDIWHRGGARASGEEFRLLVDSVIDYAIFLLDPDGIVRTWNPGAERLKGYRAEEIIGRSFSRFYPEQDRASGLPDRLLEEARRSGRTEVSGWRVRKDGTRFWADVVITALEDEDGVHLGFGKVTRDMTELHLAQQERDEALEREREAVRRLQQLDDWRRDFVRSVAHDIKSPVAALSGFAQLLGDGGDPEERSLLVERIRANAQTLSTMIDHLQTYVSIETDRITLDIEELPLRPFLEELAANMQPLLSGHELRVDVDGDLTVPADRQALERVLRNLLGNAVRHTAPGGTITVAARRSEGQVSLEVRDTGEGVPPDLLPVIFDKFRRGPGGRTGLGLAIVKEYVGLHGGDIAVESVRGDGTTVRVHLPTVAPMASLTESRGGSRG